MTSKTTTTPLSTIAPGQKVRLAAIDAGHELRSRLAALGMVPNTEILVVSNARPGPFLINVKGAKIAIGRGMAQKVMVVRNGLQE